MNPSVAEVFQLLQTVQRAVHRSKALTRTVGPWQLTPNLTMAQLRALMTLADSDHLTVGQLAERLGTGMPAASSIVDRLVEEGMANRHQDPADRRRIVVSPSEEGVARIDGMRQGPKEVLMPLLSRLTEDELQALIRGLRGFARVAQEIAAETDKQTPAEPAGAPGAA